MYRLWQSFLHAGRGLIYGLAREFNLVLLFLFAGLAIVAVGWHGAAPVAWAVLVLSVGILLAAELFNTALERLADLLQPRLSSQVRTIKDLLAAAVLVLALALVVVTILVLFG